MSRDTRRKPGPNGQPSRQANAAREPSLASVFDTALRAARGISAEDDPLQAEVFASGLLATFDRPLVDQPDPVAFFGGRLVAHLVGKRSPDALALLHAVAAVAPESVANAARSAITRLRAAGRADPSWAAHVGRARSQGAWASIDEFGDQEVVAVTFGYDDGRTHALTFMIDHNFEGLVRQAFIGDDPEAIRREWEETSHLPIVPLDAQKVADRLAQALRMYDLYLDPPCAEDVPELVPLMKARLRVTLPPGREPERREATEAQRAELVASFAAAREAGSSARVAQLARTIVDYRFDHTDGDPLRWSPIAVELCLLDWFPRKVTLDDADVAAVPDALRRWVKYSGRRKRLAGDAVAETLAAIAEFEPEFREAMRDPRRSGSAKSIVAAMMREGVDLTDQREIAGWIQAFNDRPRGERVDLSGDPDGSGNDEGDTARRPELRVLPGGSAARTTRMRRTDL